MCIPTIFNERAYALPSLVEVLLLKFYYFMVFYFPNFYDFLKFKNKMNNKDKVFLYAVYEKLGPRGYVKGSLTEFCYGRLFDIKLKFLSLFRCHYDYVYMRTQKSLKQIKPN